GRAAASVPLPPRLLLQLRALQAAPPPPAELDAPSFEGELAGVLGAGCETRHGLLDCAALAGVQSALLFDVLRAREELQALRRQRDDELRPAGVGRGGGRGNTTAAPPRHLVPHVVVSRVPAEKQDDHR
ncbi:unnamed protein product, partial [Prorocentrum cordatum]